MFANLSSEYFNLIEGGFWIVLGFVCLIIYFKNKSIYKNISLFSSFILITFGISDFFQVAYGSFLVPGMEWLFIWKIIDVIGLFAILIWYIILKIRIQKNNVTL